jgi:AcrR family transcriptional regulator
MTKITRAIIIDKAKQLFALHGYEGFSMRILASESGTGLSSIYHFFGDKDEILQEIFDATSTELGQARAKLPTTVSAEQMLLDRIYFQFHYIEDIVFVLKYYLHFRQEFAKNGGGYLPAKGYLHIEEVLNIGVQNGDFAISVADVDTEAKVIAHAINGYLLEYYPHPPTKQELDEVCRAIHTFIMRSLTNKEVPMK